MVLVFGVARFVGVAAGVEKFDGTTAGGRGRLCGGFVFLLLLGQRWRLGREFPFDESYIFGDGVGKRWTDGYGGGGLGVGAEGGYGGGGEVEGGGYAAV